MGTKYSTVTVTSYNASPPSDDGLKSASNQITWAKHKTKLTDPLKTAVEAIDTALVAALNQSAIAKTDTYTVTAAEHAKTIEVTTASAGVDVILLDASTAAAGFFTEVVNAADSTSNLTVKLATNTDFLQTVTDGTILMPPDSSMVFKVNSGADGYIATGGRNLVLNKTVAVAIDTVSVGAGTLRTLTVQDKDYTIADDADVSVNSQTEDASPDLSADYVRTYDADAGSDKKVLAWKLGGSISVGEQSGVSAGTSLDFTTGTGMGKIFVLLDQLSLSGSDELLIQLGVNGAPDVSGYVSSSALLPDGGATNVVQSTSGFVVQGRIAGSALSGIVTLIHQGGNTWIESHSVQTDASGGHVSTGGGAMTATGEVDMVRVTVTGTNEIDAGAVNVKYEA